MVKSSLHGVVDIHGQARGTLPFGLLGNNRSTFRVRVARADKVTGHVVKQMIWPGSSLRGIVL